MIDDIYTELGGEKGRFRGTSYGLSRDNTLGKLLQTPNLWGVNPATWGHSLKDLPAAKNLLETIKGTIALAHETVDIATLRPLPDGFFLQAIRDGLQAAAKNNPALVVRLLIGHHGPDIFKPSELEEFVRTLAPPAGFTVYLAASRTAAISWNHSKLIIVDGHRVIGGGHNLWSDAYCKLAPVHDVSMLLAGGAAAVAQSFLNLIWRDVAEGSRGHDPSNLVYSRMLFGGMFYANALPVIAANPVPSDGTTPVLAVARLGRNLGGASEKEAAASQIARIKAVKLAKKSIKLSQQMLDNKIIDHDFINYWDDELIKELGAAVVRGVDVSIVITGDGAGGGYAGIGIRATAMHLRDSVAKASGKSGADLTTLCTKRLHVAPLRFFPKEPPYVAWEWVNADGSLAVPGNHAKLYIIDDELFYVGSDNAYPIPFGKWGLQEFGFIGSTPGTLWADLDSYWKSLWLYSSPLQHDWNSTISGPAIAIPSWAIVRFALYGTAKDGTVLEKACLVWNWDPWSSIGTPRVALAGPIAGVSWVTGRYGLYALDANGAIQERAWAGTAWSDWTTIDAPKAVKVKDLAAVSWIADQYGLYAIDTNGEVREKVFKPGGWKDWGSIGKPGNVTLAGPITAVCWSTGRYGIYALDVQGAVWQKWWATSWSGWDKIPGPKDAKLKSISSGAYEDRQYVIAGISEDGDLWMKRYEHGWYEWEKVGRPGATKLDGAVGVWANDTSLFIIVVRGTDELLSYYESGARGWHAVDLT